MVGSSSLSRGAKIQFADFGGASFDARPRGAIPSGSRRFCHTHARLLHHSQPFRFRVCRSLGAGRSVSKPTLRGPGETLGFRPRFSQMSFPDPFVPCRRCHVAGASVSQFPLLNRPVCIHRTGRRKPLPLPPRPGLRPDKRSRPSGLPLCGLIADLNRTWTSRRIPLAPEVLTRLHSVNYSK